MTEDFRVIARRRLAEAEALFAAGEFSGAYYLAGYAVECGLKACILKNVRRFHMPDKATVAESHTHDLAKLVDMAGLKSDREAQQAADPVFARNWALVRGWNENSRYESWSEQEADELIRAVKQRKSGVLRWTTKHW